MKPKIIKVWGKADNIDLLFTKVGTEWQCSVPADTVDGTYACELTAQNENGAFGFWVGFLYMCNGICHFELRPVNYRLMFDEETSSNIHFANIATKLIFEERCRHHL